MDTEWGDGREGTGREGEVELRGPRSLWARNGHRPRRHEVRGGRTEPFLLLQVVREYFGDEVDDGDEDVSRRRPPFIVLLDQISSGDRCRSALHFWGCYSEMCLYWA